MGYAPTPDSRRSSAPRPHQPTPTYIQGEELPSGRSRSIQSGLTGAFVAFVLGRIFVPAAYPQLIKANDWWWKVIIQAPGSHGFSHGLADSLLVIPITLISLASMVVGLGALIALWIAYILDRFYLFPFIGFLVGRGAGGPLGQALLAPFRAAGGFLVVFVLSIVDVFRYPKLSHRLASLGVLVLGISAFVFAGKVVLPLARRGAEPATRGEEVVRYLPSTSWVSEQSIERWRFSLTDVSLHEDYLEVTLLTQNSTRRARPLAVNPRTRLVFLTSGIPMEPPCRLLAVDGEIPMAPATASIQPGAVRTLRLRFARPVVSERVWSLNLALLIGTERGNAGTGTNCILEFDLRPAKKGP